MYNLNLGACALGAIFKKSLPKPSSWRFIPTVFSKSLEDVRKAI